ncbi:hypothetical protein LLEC1_01184 [Akanthomyces lecanii]|uniref:SH3 domain-containing protein n=1 Tax=Cordyceps confragosa TaxID=2714763 RepID=A0A179IBZ2_CORDF|nr:hypothetical protein LLEC1_01184 [Akanthomyces lecanii]
MDILNSRVFSGMRAGTSVGDDSIYNDVPTYNDSRDDFDRFNSSAAGNGPAGPRRTSTWQDDTYDRDQGYNAPSRAGTFSSSNRNTNNNNNGYYDNPPSDRKQPPGRPSAPKPSFNTAASLNKNEAIALYNFDADQPGDLGFKKGDVITVLKKTESDNDWWTGMVGTRHGIFPSNYVKMRT